MFSTRNIEKPPMKKILLGIAVVIILVLSAILYIHIALPNVDPAPDLMVEITEERLIHGAYLANHVAACMDCHAVRDWSLFSAPPVPGSLGAGGERFGREMGLPGELYSANVTPHKMSAYTDGELFRLITTGVTRDNRVMFPLMPYKAYSHMDREDVNSIIAYIRSLDPIENDIPSSNVDFPMNLLIKLEVPTFQDVKRPDAADRLAYGQYLIIVGACADCHNYSDGPTTDFENPFRGGMEFKFSSGAITRSANITPDSTTGIGLWTEQMFVDRFKAFDPDSTAFVPVMDGGFNTPMPWTMYAGMTDDDLRAIYAYLRTVRPITSAVERFTAP